MSYNVTVRVVDPSDVEINGKIRVLDSTGVKIAESNIAPGGNTFQLDASYYYLLVDAYLYKLDNPYLLIVNSDVVVKFVVEKYPILGIPPDDMAILYGVFIGAAPYLKYKVIGPKTVGTDPVGVRSEGYFSLPDDDVVKATVPRNTVVEIQQGSFVKQFVVPDAPYVNIIKYMWPRIAGVVIEGPSEGHVGDILSMKYLLINEIGEKLHAPFTVYSMNPDIVSITPNMEVKCLAQGTGTIKARTIVDGVLWEGQLEITVTE